MKKVLRVSAVVLFAATIAVLTIPSSHATCANSNPIIGQPVATQVNFGSVAADTSPQDGVSPIQAAYWRVNAGNPATGSGSDNGIWGNDAANGGPWFLDLAGDGNYYTLGLTDHDGASDGCINGANDSGGDADDRVILAGCGPDGNFFAVAAGNADGSVFDFGNGPYTAAPTPKPVITQTTKSGTGVTIVFTTPTAAAFASNYFDNSPGATVPISSIFTGIKIYSTCVARAAAAPARLLPSASWTLIGSFPLGATGQSASVDCGAGMFDTYLGTEPVFDGATPFTAGCVSGTTSPVQTGTLATPSDGTPRTIKKPRGIRPANPN